MSCLFDQIEDYTIFLFNLETGRQKNETRVMKTGKKK